MGNLQALLCDELKSQLTAKGVVRVTIPAGGDLLWRWFNDLSATRSYHMAGPNPISYAEISGYSRLMGLPIEPRHVAVIRAMDRTYIEAAYSKRQQAPDGVKTLPPVSEYALTDGMFDAMFG
ncbi:hypothetical protein [Rhizobium sp. Root483D2]|uniref:phage tail assembly chaperone n=1 Tax=Rhizobium sp. Root483D2 TaxID=1736545 RepID=UPI0007158CA5|nr:hypothetical protein [Rhizobium sp. Root483D2]KQY21029.1 hypothetical protein ASD32_06520 [Rhizobium sp. Root483D2]